MKLLLSSPNPQGYTVLVELAEEAEIEVTFTDDMKQRLITQWVPDLILVGLNHLYRTKNSLEGAPADQIEVGRVSILNANEADVRGFFLHPDSGTAKCFLWDEMMPLLASGISEQITTGTAEEAAHAPDDLSSL